MLSASFDKTPENVDAMIRFVADTVVDDGRIPHLSVDAVEEVIKIAGEMAYSLDGTKNSLTLRLRELGGIIRASGDIAVQEGSDVVGPLQVRHARHMCSEIDPRGKPKLDAERSSLSKDDCGSYFF
jgi:Lon-like ATP-dependent protease